MGIKKNKNAIIGTVDLEHNVFYAEKREVDSNLIHGVAYSPFEAFRMTNYPGDESAAIEALKSMGYGIGKDFQRCPVRSVHGSLRIIKLNNCRQSAFFS